MYLRDKDRTDSLRITSIDDLDSSDIEEIYNDFYL